MTSPRIVRLKLKEGEKDRDRRQEGRGNSIKREIASLVHQQCSYPVRELVHQSDRKISSRSLRGRIQPRNLGHQISLLIHQEVQTKSRNEI